MKRRLGICMVTGAYYPEISGGGLQCRTLINSLRDKELNFFVLTTTKNPLLKNDDLNALIYRINIGKMSLWDNFKTSIKIIHIFINLHHKIDIVHLHGFSNKTLLFILLAKIFRKQVIQKMTSLGEDDPVALSHRRFGNFKRFFFSRSDFFISVNSAMSRRFLDSGFPPTKLLTVPNGVDTEKFYPPKDLNEKNTIKDQLGLPKHSQLILFVGFFSKDKAPDLLYKAFKKISCRINHDVHILFIGSTEESYFEIDPGLSKAIKDDAMRLGIDDKILFVRKTLEIEKYYRASDLFVLPSYREGLPNALLEAMATSLACISSDLEGIKDYVITSKVNGLCFGAGNLQELSEAIYDVLTNKELAEKLGQNARKSIIKNFSIRRISDRFYDIYTSKLGANNA